MSQGEHEEIINLLSECIFRWSRIRNVGSFGERWLVNDNLFLTVHARFTKWTKAVESTSHVDAATSPASTYELKY